MDELIRLMAQMPDAKSNAKAGEATPAAKSNTTCVFAEWYGVQEDIPNLAARLPTWKRLRDVILSDGKSNPPKVSVATAAPELELKVEWPTFALKLNDEVEWGVGAKLEGWITNHNRGKKHGMCEVKPTKEKFACMCWKGENADKIAFGEDSEVRQKISATEAPLVIRLGAQSSPLQVQIVAYTKIHHDTVATFTFGPNHFSLISIL
jgi:hypothetical protein